MTTTTAFRRRRKPVREAPGGGPALDIGYSFWSWYNQCAFVHDGFVAAPIVDCTVRYNASLGGTSYLQYWNNTRFSGGGIYARGNTQLYGDHLFGENMVQAVVYLDIGDVDLGFPVGTFNDVQSADSISTVSVQNNGRGLITCTDCFNVVGTAIQYNAGIIEEVPALLLAGQVGVGGIVAKLQTGTTRRVFSSTTGPYRNIARPFSWQPGTPLSLVPGPDGMATSAATGATHATIYSLFDAADGYELPAAGDRYVVGAWLKLGDNPPGGYSGSVMANNGTGNINATVFAPGSTGFVPTDFVPGQVAGWFSSAQNVQVGQWFWAWGWIKINSVTAGTRLVIQAVLDPNVISRPWVIRIPAGDGVQDAEIAELALNGYGSPAFAGTPLTNTAPLSPDPGMPALWPGQKLAFWDATLGAWKYLDIDNGAVRVT